MPLLPAFVAAAAIGVALPTAALGEAGPASPPVPPAPANDTSQRANRPRPARHDRRHHCGRDAGSERARILVRRPDREFRLVQPAAQSAERIALDLAAAGEPGRDDRCLSRGALPAFVGGLPADRIPRQGLAHFQSRQERPVPDPGRRRANSQLANFTLEVFLPTPAVRPPGLPLPAAGVNGKVDRIQNINAAYSFTMHAGVSYLINLANKTEGACVSGSLFPHRHELVRRRLPALFTSTAAATGSSHPDRVRAGATASRSHPAPPIEAFSAFTFKSRRPDPPRRPQGLSLATTSRARAPGRARCQRSAPVSPRCHQSLKPHAQAARTRFGRLQSATAQPRGHRDRMPMRGKRLTDLQHQLQPGPITRSSPSEMQPPATSRSCASRARSPPRSLSFSSNTVAPGQGLSIDVQVSPAASGPLTVEIERFDPVFGWQFYRQVPAFVSEGTASVPFVPPAVGRWRAKATYAGSRPSSPSAVGFSYLLVS